MSATKITKMTRTTIQSQLHIEMKGFERHCCSTITENLWTEPLADCIIWSKNRKFICHRLVLSMASDFLAKMLAEVSVPGFVPELIIPDVRPQVLELVITLMYTGEVCVPRKLRDQFVEACELLKLKNTDDFVEEGVGGHYDPFVSTVESVTVDGVYAEEYDDTSAQIGSSHYDEMQEESEQDEMDEQEDGTESFGALELNSPVKKRRKYKAHRKYNGKRTLLDSEFDYDKYAKKKRKLPLTRASEEKRSNYQARLQRMYKRVYTQQAVRVDDLENEEFKVDLEMQGDVLLKGKIWCIFCGEPIGIVYQRSQNGDFKQWKPELLVSHLKRNHNDLMSPTVDEVVQEAVEEEVEEAVKALQGSSKAA